MEIQEMSNERLLEHKKTTEFDTGLSAGFFTVAVIATIFLWSKMGFIYVLAFDLPAIIIALPVAIWSHLLDLQSIKKELKVRNVLP